MENGKIGKITTRLPIKKMGDSHYILLNKHIKDFLHIDENMILGAVLWNIEIEKVRCNKCGFEFEDEKNQSHHCINCGQEFYNQQLKGGTK